MNKILAVAQREYKAAVLTKAFLISVAVMPLMMSGSILAEVFLRGKTGDREKKYAVLDRTPQGGLFQILDAAAKARTERLKESGKGEDTIYVVEQVLPQGDSPDAILKQRLEMSERVRKGEIKGFIEIGQDVIKPPPPDMKTTQAISKAAEKSDGMAAISSILGAMPDNVVIRYQTNNSLAMEFSRWAEQQLNSAIFSKRLVNSPVNPSEVIALARPIPVVPRELTKMDANGQIVDGPEINILIKFMVPFGIIMLMFMLIMVGATPAMSGVVEEKMQRIAEVLLGSVTPFQLMMGKLLGIVGVALTLAIVYLGGAYWAARHYGYDHYITPQIMGWFLSYSFFAVFMFGSIFIAIGAACSDTKETQALLSPVMILICIPLFLMSNIIREPESQFAVGASLFPLATPMLMTARVAILPNLPLWQPLAGLVLVVLTTLFFVWAAGRIFRVGLLMQGKGANFREMARWVIRG